MTHEGTTSAPTETTPAPEPTKKTASEFGGQRCKKWIDHAPGNGDFCQEPPPFSAFGYCEKHQAMFMAAKPGMPW